MTNNNNNLKISILEQLTLLDTNDNFFNINISPLYPQIYLILSILILVTLFPILDYLYKKKYIYIKLISFFSYNIIFWTIIILFNQFKFNYSVFSDLIIIDVLSNTVALILIMTLFLCLILSSDYFKSEKISNYEYLILLLLALLGLLTVCYSNNFLIMYLGLELQSLSFYILATYKQYSNFSTEAGLKYFIIGAFSSGMILFGISIIYGFTGLLNFSELELITYADFNYSNEGILFGFLFVSVGLFFKIGAAPFHMWLPDVYEGVPTIVTLVYSTVPKIVVFNVFLRIYFNLSLAEVKFWTIGLVFIIISSLLIGTFGALYQTKIKRLLSYSAISHVGFLLCAFLFPSYNGLFAFIFYIFVYITISIFLFGFLLSIRKRKSSEKIKNISELVSLANSNNYLSFSLCLVLFSLAGIPPLIGFFGKFYIFLNLIELEYYLLALILVITSVISSMYYIRLIKLMFFSKPKRYFFFENISKLKSLLISFFFLFNLFFLFFPFYLIDFFHNLILMIVL